MEDAGSLHLKRLVESLLTLFNNATYLLDCFRPPIQSKVP